MQPTISTSSSSNPANASTPATVLIVDARPLFRAALAAIVDGAGYHAMVFDNAADAMFEIHRASLVVFDVDLPGLDGTRLLSALSREGRLARLPVIALSASNDPSVTARLRVLGVQKVLPKKRTDLADVARAIETIFAAQPPAPSPTRRQPIAA